jgi:hypothetical protein
MPARAQAIIHEILMHLLNNLNPVNIDFQIGIGEPSLTCQPEVLNMGKTGAPLDAGTKK